MLLWIADIASLTFFRLLVVGMIKDRSADTISSMIDMQNPDKLLLAFFAQRFPAICLTTQMK